MKIKSNSTLDVDLTDKIIVMKEKTLAKQHRLFENRFWKATGGFGCNPSALGATIFATCLSDGEQSRWRRGDFEGWLTEEEFGALLMKEKAMTIEQFMMWNRLSAEHVSNE